MINADASIRSRDDLDTIGDGVISGVINSTLKIAEDGRGKTK